jgi:hypothetical protein
MFGALGQLLQVLFESSLWMILLAEMSNKTVLFPSDSEIDHIHRIFR